MKAETLTCDVAIIGAGTAGLSARREVADVTDSYFVIDDGPLGTTCARVGCMPSKVLIQVANDFHRRHVFADEGICGAEQLKLDGQATMRHVRKLRDRFVRGVIAGLDEWRTEHLLRGRARFDAANTLTITDAQGTRTLKAKRIIIATGSSPIIPGPWRPLAHRLIDTDAFFELDELPKSMAVIGLGVIGLELGQAIARLGVDVRAFTLDKALGGLSDPEIQACAFDMMAAEFPIALAGVDGLSERDGMLIVTAGGEDHAVDKAFVTMGRRPNIAGLNLQAAGVTLDARGMPQFDASTFRIADSSLWFVGDANGVRPLLHEAADEGRIAGYNAARDGSQCFKRRTFLAITFSEPNIAVVGKPHARLVADNDDFVTGAVSYRGQGRAIVKLQEGGALHVYAERSSGRLLGAEMCAPDGEHLAHLLAWAVATGLTVQQTLSLPFYHPVLEEGVRTALRHAARQVDSEGPALEVLRCQDPPVGCWG